MLFKIAWRNIWRSRTRSLVVIGAIAIGVWAVIFLISFSSGMVTSYINNAIENEISHIQIHHPDFIEDEEVKYFIENPENLISDIQMVDGVKAATLRSISNGMLSTSKGGGRGIRIKAIDPISEALVTHLDEKIKEGKYFGESRSKSILISTSLSEKMKAKVRSKLVLTFQDVNGNITALGFRVAGLFQTGNNAYDLNTVFVKREDLNPNLGDEKLTHEVAIVVNAPQNVEIVQSDIKGLYPNLLTENYKELSPEIELFQSQIKLSALIFTVIVMLGLIFGIINTMLMAVLERIREFGMLMAIGMNKVRVFWMVVLETVLLGMVAAPIGLAIGWFSVVYFSTRGIDLSNYSRGMREIGFSPIIYPNIESDFYWWLTLAVAVTAILGSLYPAFKAIKLRPVEALRKL
ncbi:MAG: FtsX-like permease family protein [Saprospiraceae bacterium]|jgi:ABC-type lipoprotein release transport system permease subunit|nr:FtsX-like permease family protein [Saprospiraceae bacterium]